MTISRVPVDVASVYHELSTIRGDVARVLELVEHPDELPVGLAEIVQPGRQCRARLDVTRHPGNEIALEVVAGDSCLDVVLFLNGFIQLWRRRLLFGSRRFGV